MGGAKQVTLVDANGSAQQVSLDQLSLTSLQTAFNGTYVPYTIATAGHPTTGTWLTGQSVIDSAGAVWNCTAGGTPGTWAAASSGGAPSGSAGGDLSSTYPNPTVAKVQGVAITSAQATLLSQINNAATRSATATVAAGEETVFTGSTASQTLTLPASPQGSTLNTFANNSSVAVTIAAGAANTVNVGSVVGSITLSPGFSVQLVYIGTVWYALDFGPTTRAYPLASDYGYQMMSLSPDLLPVTSAAMTAGTVYVTAMLLDHVATITSLDFSVATAGSSLTASQCGVALYDPTKTLIGTAFTADGATDLHTALTSTGKHTSTLVGTGTGLTGLLPGKYYAAMFQNGTTPAVLRCPANTSAVNGNLTAANSKYASADTGRTTTFPTTLGTFTAFNGANWFAAF